MGKECLWGGGKSSKRVGKGARENDHSRISGCLCSMFQLFDFPQFPFVLHQQQRSTEPRNSFLLEQLAPISKGVEKPRHSLELEKPSLPVTIQDHVDLNVPIGIQVKTKRDAMSKEQGTAKDSASSSDVISSPVIKTPTLVARLMGLDLVPDQSSLPRHSSSYTHGTSHLEGKSHVQQPFRSRHPLQVKSASHESSFDSECRGTRSLPETPRISSARRSDVEHRLSLEINKENLTPVNEEMVFCRFSSLKRNELKTEKNSRTPGHQATQIVKQVKDRVSRKVGLDITNTVGSRELERREHELVSHCKSKKFSKALTRVNVDVSSSGKYSTSSCPPRQKSLDSKNKPITSTVDTSMLSKDHHISQQTPKQPFLLSSQVNLSSQNTKDSNTKPNLRAVKEYHHRHHKKQIKLRNKVTEERFGPPSRKNKLPQTAEVVRNKHDELTVRPTTASRANIPDKKCKKTPLSNEFLHNITVSGLLPAVKKVQLPSKQVQPSAQESKCSSQLSGCSSQSYKTQTLNPRDSRNDSNNEDRTNVANTCTATRDGAAKECEYITKILRTGIDKDTPMFCTRWSCLSYPLDPSISYLLERFTTSEKFPFGQLARCCNRQLLFHIFDEVLADIRRPFISRKAWAGSSIIRQEFIRGRVEGSELVDMLCSRVRNFACSKYCLDVEDIDALVDKDLTQLWLQDEVALNEEGEGIATEIEKNIIDKLIQETAVALRNR